MKFITLSEMNNIIRDNFYKIPHDVDFILGVPRSGVIPANIIAELLNVPAVDVESFIGGAKPCGGDRVKEIKHTNLKKKVLVVDDTCFSGKSMLNTKNKLKSLNGMYDFIYLCIFLEGNSESIVDLYLEDVRKYTDNYTKIVLYEWNIFHHYDFITTKCMYDIDGVLCVDPPDERNEEAYLNYIENAIPLFIPTNTIGCIVTYRLIKNKDITLNWLKKNNVKYNSVLMFNAQSWEERNSKGISPGKYKGDLYKLNEWAELFIESDDDQAREIFNITNKPVYCVKTNKLYS